MLVVVCHGQLLEFVVQGPAKPEDHLFTHIGQQVLMNYLTYAVEHIDDDGKGKDGQQESGLLSPAFSLLEQEGFFELSWFFPELCRDRYIMSIILDHNGRV